MMRQLDILGTRGIPAAHGGFETFAERLALHLNARGWQVTVYCQEDGDGPTIEDDWQGIRRVRMPVDLPGPRGTIVFDWRATVHAARSPALKLTLGYNTAVFAAWLRLRRRQNLFNMDGIEWRRDKWGAVAKTWFWLNELAGCLLGNGLVADHPEIARHLGRWGVAGKTVTIPYGADRIATAAPEAVHAMGLVPGGYAIAIARPEPENSLAEIVAAYAARPRAYRLVVLGDYDERRPYHARVKAAANTGVLFPGAIYDRATVAALRFHARYYLHGHRVGGTNPSLVEALGCGNPVVAHDNAFNRWVAGAAGAYFSDTPSLAALLDRLDGDPVQLAAMAAAARARHAEAFTWERVLTQYEQWLDEALAPAMRELEANL
jgi:glycosyltransferase involved in cell wall biosynthesis